MSAKVDPNEETIQMGVRIPKSLAGALDAEAKRLEAQHPGLRFTRSEVARAVLTRVLLLQAPVVDPTPAVANPTPPKAPAPARQPTLPTVAPAPLTLEQAVIAELKAVEKPAKTGGELEMDLAAVVRSLEAQGHQREAIHTELKRLGTEGVDVLKLQPDSGGGNELKEDRAIVPRRMGDGVPFLKAHWKARPADPPTEQDSDALRVRFREALRLKKTSINKSAEPAGCSTTPLRRWLNDGKELDALYRENLDKFLLTVSA